MHTVAETSIFIRYATEIWSEAERQDFITFIAAKKSAVERVSSTSWPPMKLYGC
jgi:hypothetical protein